MLPIEEYDALVEAAEQRDDIRHLEENKKLGGKPISWERVEEKLRAEGKLP